MRLSCGFLAGLMPQHDPMFHGGAGLLTERHDTPAQDAYRPAAVRPGAAPVRRLRRGRLAATA
jgi:hypothetical protein